MVMKGRDIKKSGADDWRKWYVEAAVVSWLLEEEFSDYDTPAIRGWIFIMAQNAIQYSDDDDMKIIQDLINGL
jgi:hypothetical protein